MRRMCDFCNKARQKVTTLTFAFLARNYSSLDGRILNFLLNQRRNLKKEKNKMGCDIHAMMEVNDRNIWLNGGDPDISRNYDIFSLLAGVRGTHVPISEPRGIPENASAVLS